MPDNWGQNDPVVGNSDNWGQNDPVVQQSAAPQPDTSLANKAKRFGLGMAEPAIGLGQLAAHATGLGTETMDELAQKEAQAYQTARLQAGFKPEDWDYYGGAGNIASPVNAIPGGVVGRTVGLGAKTLLGAAGRGAAMGAGYGAMEPISNATQKNPYWQQKGEQTATGAAFGAPLGVASNVAGRLLSPELTRPVRTPGPAGPPLTPGEQDRAAAQVLLNANVKLSTGQIAGGIGEQAERGMADIPILGIGPRSSMHRSTASLNEVAANRALAQIGEKLSSGTRIGYDSTDEVFTKLGKAYDDTLNKISIPASLFDPPPVQPPLSPMILKMARPSSIPTPPPLSPWNQYLADLTKDASAAGVRGDGLQYLNKLIDNVNQRLQNVSVKNAAGVGMIKGREIKKIESSLSGEARSLRASNDVDNNAVAPFVDRLKFGFLNTIQSRHPKYGTQLKNINEGYSIAKIIQQATNSATGTEGIYSAQQLDRAVQSKDPSVSHGQFSRGKALLQDLSSAAARKMQPAPTSSLPERALAHAIIGGGAFLHPGIAAAAAILPTMYSTTGQNVLRRILAGQRPQAVQRAGDILRQYGAYSPALATPDIQ